MRTLEQERALFAWERVNSVCKDHPNDAKDVAMNIRKMPTMVLTNGLGQTLAFLLQKDEGRRSGPEYIVYDMIAEWVVDKRKLYAGPRADLMNQLIQGDRYLYRQAQEETWAMLAWLKKFADAYIGAGEGLEEKGSDVGGGRPHGGEGRS
ncbi:MAG TPA: type III-B CRISPR module-associated protein Cmr5 [Bacillota bacterium]|nr:type III-B CRISPR module-associated protein Cmr5 [Bacillota bacterium]HOO30243.1 type III-B CRISPR module-associated protein Cmr5 [Bacillota bacterium]